MVDECLSLLREGLAEFPKNERLLITLADTLSEAGWRRHREWLFYDDDGYIQHDYDRHKKNEYCSESVKVCEYLADNANDPAIIAKAISILVLLHRNFGENEKAASFAMRMPELKKLQRDPACRSFRWKGRSKIYRRVSFECSKGVYGAACIRPYHKLQAL